MRSARTEFVGVLGWPLTFTLSPVIHNAAFRALGLDWIYLDFPVPPEELGAAVGGLRALGAMGANVTIPHKQSVIAYLDDLSGDARSVEAVNTIQRVGDKLIGHNTDVDGFAEFLTGDAGFDPAGKSAAVIGAGGAARAVLKALGDLGVSQIAIVARRPEQARELAASTARPELVVALGWEPDAAAVEDADLIVNATPVADRDPVPDLPFRPDHVVVDLVYDPPTTPIVARARQAGATGWGGVGMLVHQAAAALQIWTGQDPPLETMSAAAIRAIRNR